jgi:hypothetical protein
MSSEPQAEEMAVLKARLAALESGKPAPKKTKGGCLGPLLGIGGVVTVIIVIGNVAGRNQPLPVAGADLKAAPIACDKAWVDKTWAAANRAGAMRGQELQGLDLIILVSPYGWNTLSLGTQKNLGLAAACQLGGAFISTTVHFRYDASGADALRLSNVDIYRLAVARFVPEPTAQAPSGFGDLKWGAAPRTNLHPLGGDSVWVTGIKPPPAYLGVTPSDEDYLFDHRRLFGGDLYFNTVAAYAQIKGAAQKAYGDPSTAENDDQKDSYAWDWRAKKVQIQLSFDKAKSSAILHFERDK